MNNSKPTRLRFDHLRSLEPLTQAQQRVFKSWDDGYNLCLSGSAGTGKTFICMYLAMKEVLDKDTPYDKLVIVRSAVPTRDMGFLPGKKEEKEAAYLDPYKIICSDLFEDHDAWNKLVMHKNVEFLTTSFIRGVTLDNAIILVDESQNCTYHELCSIITRIGTNCKFMMAGDYYQSDFTHNGDKNGIRDFMVILDHMKWFDHIQFNWGDIVRSSMVRDFIMTKEMLESGKI